MPLLHLLYRCPACGADPASGEGDEVECARCGAAFERSGEGALVRVTHPREGPSTGDREGARGAQAGASSASGLDPLRPGLVHPARLLRRIREMGGPLPAARRPDGSIRYDAPARMRRTLEEAPLRRGGRLLGFYERPGDGEDGTLLVTGEALRFEMRPRAGKGGREVEWSLPEVVGMQVSSSSIQITPRRQRMVEFLLLDDSPFRWRTLLRSLLREAYRRAGRGEIVEFQPRIVTR